jgi:hypothetical protein
VPPAAPPQALNGAARAYLTGAGASLLSALNGVESSTASIKDSLKGMQGQGVAEVQKALQQVEAASAAINDVAGKLAGALRTAGAAWCAALHSAHCTALRLSIHPLALCTARRALADLRRRRPPLAGDFTAVLSTLGTSATNELSAAKDTAAFGGNLLQVGVKTLAGMEVRGCSGGDALYAGGGGALSACWERCCSAAPCVPPPGVPATLHLPAPAPSHTPPPPRPQINSLNAQLDTLNAQIDQYVSTQGGPLAQMGAQQAKAALAQLKQRLESIKAAITAYQPGQALKQITEPVRAAVGAAAGAASSAPQGLLARIQGFFGGGGGGGGGSAAQPLRPGSMLAQLTRGGGAAAGGSGGEGMSTMLGQALASGSLDAGVMALMNNIERFTDGFNKLFPGGN